MAKGRKEWKIHCKHLQWDDKKEVSFSQFLSSLTLKWLWYTLPISISIQQKYSFPGRHNAENWEYKIAVKVCFSFKVVIT